jgi:tRNA(Ile)-lysidine synthase
MLKLLGKIPRTITVACSGGIDSMVLVDFLKRNHEVRVAYFNHGTEHGAEAAEFVEKYCHKNFLPFIYGEVSSTKDPKESQEEYWRRERYAFLDQLGDVVTAHHLDDVAETWVWSCMNGTPSLLPQKRGNVFRPFLLNRKHDLQSWGVRKNVPFIQDVSNYDAKYMRNNIRLKVMPMILTVNPGLHTMLKKKLSDRKVP